MRALPPALILFVAVAVGAAMDATIKHLAQTNPILIVSFGRYLFGTLFSLLVYFHARRPRISAEMWRAHALRGVFIASCATTFFWALSVLPLAEAVTLSFIYPLIVPFVARLMIGERIRPASLVAAGFGFLGVIIAAQGGPSAAEAPLHDLGVMAVVASAGLFAVAMVLLRQRAQTDGAVIVSLMTSLIPGMMLAAPAIVLSPPPHWPDWPGFLLMGALGAVFMYLMAQAYARAEAQQLAPIHYTELLWATAYGYLIFQEAPRPEIYIGAAFIITSCLYATYDERRLAQRGPKEQT